LESQIIRALLSHCEEIYFYSEWMERHWKFCTEQRHEIAEDLKGISVCWVGLGVRERCWLGLNRGMERRGTTGIWGYFEGRADGIC
jgi:hypothetical protein